MTARRQASTTSLSKYARASSPDPNVRSLDFCNAFWGLGDGGVDVLFARMRGAARTMDELKGFWKERAQIEEDYAKRLGKLAKLTAGRDEIGELRNSLDTLRLETDKQAGFHQQLAQQIRNDLEAPAAAFVARQTAHRKTQQAAIEKQFKTKQAQEAHVSKAREKYEADCLRINGLTAQATLVQGKDLEKIQRQLERTQQTVGANEKDFANFARILQDTTVKWEQEWKAYCDGCQDLEEERMEFTKDNVWAYANAVSMVCVSDDESCERLRLALEQFEPEKDHENFIRDYGTGNAIPEPPQFINHSVVGASLPSSPSKPVTRPAQFVRSSQRMRLQNTQPPPPPQDDEPVVNTAGIGAGGNAGLNRAQTQSRGSSRAQAQAQAQAYGHVNGNGTASPQAVSSRPGTSHGAESGQMVDPTTHRTMLVVGDNAYDVDPNKHPQQQQVQGSVGNRASMNGAPKPGDESDPLAQQMANLQRAANNTTIGRSGTRKGTIDSANAPPSSASPSKALTPPTSVSPAHQNRDYRNSAELVVGAYPVQPGSSRPSSPNPPTASFMKPPTQPSAPVVDSTIADYHQRFPEERGQRRSRSNSRASWNGPPPPQHPQQQQKQQQQQQLQQTPQRQHSHGQSLDRPVSREGHAGIGANGRSPSPSLRHPSMQPPAASPTRSISPAAAQQADRRESYRSQRAVSSNSVGIALDPTGKVAMDSMADQYMQQQRQQQQQAPPPVQQQQPQQPPYQQHMQQPPPQQLQAPPPQQQVQRRPSVSGHPYATAAPVQAAPPTNSYGMQPQGQQAYRPPGQPQQQQQQPAYMQTPAYAPPQQPPPQQQMMYGQPPPQVFHAPPPAAGYGLQRGPSMNQGDYYGPPPPQLGYPQQQQQMGYGGYRAVSPGPINRSPSPQPMAIAQPQQQQQQQHVVPPTRQYTEDGRGVLFYVKALYDYNATIPEEFDFQSGDIIAVTATPEDGWWSGELLDEARRVPGRHIFPSNFVSLF